MTKKIYLETLKSVLSLSILHYWRWYDIHTTTTKRINTFLKIVTEFIFIAQPQTESCH